MGRKPAPIKPRRTATKLFLLLVLLWPILLSTGCVGLRGGMWQRQPDSLAGAPKPRWSDDPQVEEVVDHLNRNVDKLQSWRANSVKIRANGFPVSGTLAVERGRHLRLVVNSVAGSEVDLGSNDQVFWVWSKRMPPPEYIYCKHSEIDDARQAFGIPFEPDWLMQALGVERFDARDMQLEIEPTMKSHGRLVQQITSAHGQPLRRTVLVDLKQGLVREHAIHAHNGSRIASARLVDHLLDKPSGVVLPRRVELEWPQNEMSLVMHLGQVEVNPRGIPAQVWAMPQMPNVQMADLGAEARGTGRVASTSRSKGTSPKQGALLRTASTDEPQYEAPIGRAKLVAEDVEFLDEPVDDEADPETAAADDADEFVKPELRKGFSTRGGSSGQSAANMTGDTIDFKATDEDSEPMVVPTSRRGHQRDIFDEEPDQTSKQPASKSRTIPSDNSSDDVEDKWWEDR